MKTILVPTDFSSNSKNALLYAINIARKSNAKLVLLHAYYLPAYIGNGASVGTFYDDDDEKQVYRELEDLKNEIPELNFVSYEIEATSGFAIEEILSAIDEREIDLVVMGTQGASGLKEILLGSNTAKIIEEAVCPVLAIPENIHYKAIKNIVFAYDYEDIKNFSKLKMLLVFAEIFNAEIQVLHIKNNTENIPLERAIAGAELLDYIGKVKHKNKYTIYFDDNIERGINKFIREKNIDILAIMPRKHNLLAKLLRGSLTNRMAMHIKIPLLSMPE